jgi:hypothetical protein
MHEACILHEKCEMHTQFWSKYLKEQDHLGDLGVDERIILRWVLHKWGMTMWIGFIWLRIQTLCQHSLEPSGSIQSKEFLDQVTTSFFKRTLFHGVIIL